MAVAMLFLAMCASYGFVGPVFFSHYFAITDFIFSSMSCVLLPLILRRLPMPLLLDAMLSTLGKWANVPYKCALSLN